jgi:hypothetical protein
MTRLAPFNTHMCLMYVGATSLTKEDQKLY